MNTVYLEKAKERVPNVPLLINLISRRVRQLNRGERPFIKPDSPGMPAVDLALKEIAEGKLTAEINYTPPPSTEKATSGNVITL